MPAHLLASAFDEFELPKKGETSRFEQENREISRQNDSNGPQFGETFLDPRLSMRSLLNDAGRFLVEASCETGQDGSSSISESCSSEDEDSLEHGEVIPGDELDSLDYGEDVPEDDLDSLDYGEVVPEDAGKTDMFRASGTSKQYDESEIHCRSSSATVVDDDTNGSSGPFVNMAAQFAYRSSTEGFAENGRNEDIFTDHEAPDSSANQSHGDPNMRIDLPQLVYPRSLYDGITPPMEISQEAAVLQEFHGTLQPEKSELYDQDYTEYELSDFCVYVPGNMAFLGNELISLNNLGKISRSKLLFDGIISNGQVRRYVQKVPFENCSIGNYGEDIHQVNGDIWIQSLLNKSVFYRLKEPATEYRRFHEDFLWLADLCKYFVDFLQHLAEQGQSATMRHFQKEFLQYLVSKHGDEECFQEWHQKFGSDDFRLQVNRHIDFLYRHAMGVDEENEKHKVWDELKFFSKIPPQSLVEKKTIVTPYIYECFKEMKYSHWLKPKTPVATNQRISTAMPIVTVLKNSSDGSRNAFKGNVLPGDVLGVSADSKETRLWKGEDEVWYVYVQGVERSPRGRRILKVLWLYKPADTICGNGKYPFANELFMSDHCNCKHKEELDLDDEDIHCKVSVAFHGEPLDSKEKFFIRSTYFQDQHTFVTLQDSHLQCEHRRSSMPKFEEACHKFQKGETVLVVKTSDSKTRLEPCEIVDFLEHPRHRVRLRRLLRRNEIGRQRSCLPNELVYSEDLFEAKVDDIQRKCFVRFYTEKDLRDGTIPVPYNRNGTGDAFFITTRLRTPSLPAASRLQAELQLVPIDGVKPDTLIEGFDPHSEPVRNKLRGLDLFCGGGNFGRGLAEGGAVEHLWAVDYDKYAIHTYAANLGPGAKTALFRGSVNDMLSQAMDNKDSALIPRPGDVEVMSAGNPCVAFSGLNSKRGNEEGLKNQSLVASVASYIDFYRPKYAFLENVVRMASGKDSSFSTLLCAVVGLGYQLQVFGLDAHSFGSPQSRSRLIVSLAAPGYDLPSYPALSHSHPPNSNKNHSLGKAANGDSFGVRKLGPATFPFLTAAEATKDLVKIGDGQTKICIKYPDHVVLSNTTCEVRARIKLIPRYPLGMNLYKTFSAGRRGSTIVDPEVLMTDAEASIFGPKYTKNKITKESFGKSSKAYGRMRPDAPFRCVVCVAALSCSRTGTLLHWDEHRLQTIMEARRAQSIPDDEILTGPRSAQIRCVGNSVPRSMSLALGLSLRSAWLGMEDDDKANMGSTKSLDVARSNMNLGRSLDFSDDEILESRVLSLSSPEPAEDNRRSKNKVKGVAESRVGSVQGAFNALLEAIKTNEPAQTANMDRIRLRGKGYEVLLRKVQQSRSTSVEDSAYESSPKIGEKRRRC